MVLVRERELRLVVIKEGEEVSYNYIGQKHFLLLLDIVFSCLFPEKDLVLEKF